MIRMVKVKNDFKLIVMERDDSQRIMWRNVQLFIVSLH